MNEYIHRKIRWKRKSKNVDLTVNIGSKHCTKNEEILNEKLTFFVQWNTLTLLPSKKAMKGANMTCHHATNITMSPTRGIPMWHLMLQQPDQNRKLPWKSTKNSFIKEQIGWPSYWIVLENHRVAIKNWNSKLKI